MLFCFAFLKIFLLTLVSKSFPFFLFINIYKTYYFKSLSNIIKLFFSHFLDTMRKFPKTFFFLMF